MIPAAIQLVAPFQPTVPAHNARAPVVATLEPSLLLMRPLFGRLGPRFGQHHQLDATRGSMPLVHGGMDTAIQGKQPGWALEHLQMMVQTPRQLRVLGWIALQNCGADDDAALHLIQPDDTPKPRGASGLALADNRRMVLEHTPQFLRRGHIFLLDHPPRRLRDYLADQRDDVV